MSFRIRPGLLHLDGYAGRTTQAVLVIGETPLRYRIRALAKTRLGGRNRWIDRGAIALIPKRAITFEKGAANG